MEETRCNFDNLVWDRNDEAWEESQKQLRLKASCRIVEFIVEQKFGKRTSLISPLIMGGYNILYRLRLQDSPANVLLRVPCPNLAQFPIEKTLREITTLRFIGQNTQVPVSPIFFHGQDPVIGSFMILQYVNNRGTLSNVLMVPTEHLDTPHVLNHNIAETTLKDLYRKVARCLLQLAQPTLPRMGSLAQAGENTYLVAGRPITQNMNNMI